MPRTFLLSLFVLSLAAPAAAQEGRVGSRGTELREAREALRDQRGSDACYDHAARTRRAMSRLEAASGSAHRERRLLHQARERLHDCLFDHRNAQKPGRPGRPPQGPTVTPRQPPPAPPQSNLPVIVTRSNGSLVTSGPVLADLRMRATDVRQCVARHPQGVRSPFRMTITVQRDGRYGSLRIPASATPPLTQCMARTVPRWRVPGGQTGEYRVEIHLTPPARTAPPPPTVTPRTTPRPPSTPTPPPTPSAAAAPLRVVNARNQPVTSGPIVTDLSRRVAAFRQCAAQNPRNTPVLFQFTVTFNSSGQLVEIRLPSGLDVNFESCVSGQTAAWRVSGAGHRDAGLYGVTMLLRP